MFVMMVFLFSRQPSHIQNCVMHQMGILNEFNLFNNYPYFLHIIATKLFILFGQINSVKCYYLKITVEHY